MNLKWKQLAAAGMLTAAALIVFVIEAQIPPIVPIPGIKLGLSNVVTWSVRCGALRFIFCGSC